MRAHPQRTRRVILESPYAGDVAANVEYARKCVRDSLMRGEAPLASHLLYTQEGILDDSDAEQRSLGIDAGHAWLSRADAMVVYTDRGVSPGMRIGILRAKGHGIPIEYRTIEPPIHPAPYFRTLVDWLGTNCVPVRVLTSNEHLAALLMRDVCSHADLQVDLISKYRLIHVKSRCDLTITIADDFVTVNWICQQLLADASNLRTPVVLFEMVGRHQPLAEEVAAIASARGFAVYLASDGSPLTPHEMTAALSA